MKLRRSSKRTAVFIVVGVIIALIVAGVYAWQSYSAWESYGKRLQLEQQEFKRLKQDIEGAGTPKERLQAIRELDDKVRKRDELCKISGLYGWQASVVPILKDGVSQCRKAVKRLDTIAGPLNTLRDYLDVTTKLQAIVATLATTENLNESNWATLGLDRAKRAQKDIAALRAEGDATKLTSQAEDYTKKLVEGWEALIKANAAKDKTAFMGASANVAAAYASFAGLADTADGTVTDLAKKLQQSDIE